jgi:hypothetical protein
LSEAIAKNPAEPGLIVNEQEQTRTLVNNRTAPQGWLPVKLSLRSWAGSEARLRLIQNATSNGPVAGYWASVKLIETPLDACQG